MTYDECKQQYVEETIHEFKNSKLKMRNGMPVKTKQQAIAIGLSMAQRKCIISKKDFDIMEKKIIKFLANRNDSLPLTDVVETRLLITMYKLKNKSKAHKLQMQLYNRIIIAGVDGVKISHNIWEELRDIMNIMK